MNRLIRTLVGGGAVALMLAGGLASPASAAPTSRFAAQARLAHLTPAKVAQLQRQVDAIVAKTGGVQTAINEVSIPGADILLPLPGEAKARDFNAVANSDPNACPYTNFCAYSNTNYTGIVTKMWKCGNYELQDYTGVGIYVNNQTPHTVATFKNQTFGILGYSQPAITGPVVINWEPIWYVQNC